MRIRNRFQWKWTSDRWDKSAIGWIVVNWWTKWWSSVSTNQYDDRDWGELIEWNHHFLRQPIENSVRIRFKLHPRICASVSTTHGICVQNMRLKCIVSQSKMHEIPLMATIIKNIRWIKCVGEMHCVSFIHHTPFANISSLKSTNTPNTHGRYVTLSHARK